MALKESLADKLAKRQNALKSMYQRVAAPKAPRVGQNASSPQAAPKVVLKDAAAAAAPVARVQDAQLEFSLRTQPDISVQPQPWVTSLGDQLLHIAETGKTHLSLVWPTKLENIVPIHALASLARVNVTDLEGFRTLFFPGTASTSAALQATLVRRKFLADLIGKIWHHEDGRTVCRATRRCDSFEALVGALRNIQSTDPLVPPPSLAETIPTFLYRDSLWEAPINKPIERSLAKVSRLSYRSDIRSRVQSSWNDAAAAPGALYVVHGKTGKKDWRAAVAKKSGQATVRPDAMLIDATIKAQRRTSNLTRSVISFLATVRSAYDANLGALIVTDDPSIYLILGAALRSENITHNVSVYAAEAEDSIFSAHALPADWVPPEKSSVKPLVAVVDIDAARLGAKFYALGEGLAEPGADARNALAAACAFILRLSNFPGGVRDLHAINKGDSSTQYTLDQHDWINVSSRVRAVLATGALNHVRVQTETALQQGEKLAQSWSECTPMGHRLLAEVQKWTQRTGTLAVVLPTMRYIEVASQFLSRKLGDAWLAIEPRIEWHTLISVTKELDDWQGRQLLFVGGNSDVLRLLLSHPDIPASTQLFVSYRQADAHLKTLRGMLRLSELEPYKKRISLLQQGIDESMPSGARPNMDRLASFSFVFPDPEMRQSGGPDQQYYRLELEDGRLTYRAGWAYRYTPDEDPFFKRVAVANIRKGDLIFDMSDGLKSKIEAALNLNQDVHNASAYPQRALLKLYRDAVSHSSALHFPEHRSLGALADAIVSRMKERDSRLGDFSSGRAKYWLELPEGDNRPHAPRDKKHFTAFCSVLNIDEQITETYWYYIKNARNLNQHIGKLLAAQYSEILFAPESAMAYRGLSADTVEGLQQEALSCTYRIEKIEPPSVLKPEGE